MGEFCLVTGFHSCLASIVLLNRDKSLKPNPPSLFLRLKCSNQSSGFSIIVTSTPIKLSNRLLHRVSNRFGNLETRHDVDGNDLKERFSHNKSACFGKEILSPRVDFQSEFLKKRLTKMNLFASVREWNAEISAEITKRRNIQERTNVVFEMLGSMFIKNNMGFVEIDFLTRSFAKFLESNQDFLKAFMSSLTKDNNIIHKG